MTATQEAATDLIDAAKALVPQIEAYGDQSERDRTMPKELVRAIAEAGLFRIWVPKALGGYEANIETNLRVIEEIARADGAAGWNVMIAGTGGMFAAYMPEQAAREIFGDRFATVAGALAPKGRAVPVDGGFRVSGQWPLASGCLHASWLAGGSFIFDGDGQTPRMGDLGIPDLKLFFAPKDECEILDTWYSAGLRGTGSHDFAVKDMFVPEDRAFSLMGKAHHDGTLYRAGILNVFSPPVAAVALGIARGALDAFEELAGSKTPTFSFSTLRDRTTVQAQVAQAEALVRSARAFLFEVAGSMWETMRAGDQLSEEQEALVRLSCTHTAAACAEAVDIVYTLGGATSVYATSKLERCFRDVHVVTQHIAVSYQWYERTGQYFLGMGLARF
ncbi:MAG: acyl-CoA dehydrogenase family protein [Dehalococcoidia bacterium]